MLLPGSLSTSEPIIANTISPAKTVIAILAPLPNGSTRYTAAHTIHTDLCSKAGRKGFATSDNITAITAMPIFVFLGKREVLWSPYSPIGVAKISSKKRILVFVPISEQAFNTQIVGQPEVLGLCEEGVAVDVSKSEISTSSTATLAARRSRYSWLGPACSKRVSENGSASPSQICHRFSSRIRP